MTVAILGYHAIHPDGEQIEGNIQSDKRRRFNTFLCAHCNITVIMNPGRIRPRHRCKRCGGTTCDKPGCQLECNSIREGLERGYYRKEGDLNLYLHRSPQGWPLCWLDLPDGRRVLVRRKDTNEPEREPHTFHLGTVGASYDRWRLPPLEMSPFRPQLQKGDA